MMKLIRALYRDQSGAAGVEYALLVAIVAVAIAASTAGLSKSVSTAFATVVSDW